MAGIRGLMVTIGVKISPSEPTSRRFTASVQPSAIEPLIWGRVGVRDQGGAVEISDGERAQERPCGQVGRNLDVVLQVAATAESELRNAVGYAG